MPLKRSRLYGVIRPRVADLRPADSWQQDGLHLFVFTLRPEQGGHPAEAPVAVFTMHSELAEPLSGVIVTPRPDTAEADIEDLRLATGAYTVPLAGLLTTAA